LDSRGRDGCCDWRGVVPELGAAAVIGMIVFVPHLLAVADYRN
jgi:hypothetical protein